MSGYVFADEDLRLAFSGSIDRNIAVDYHIEQSHNSVHELYHLYDYSMYHDSKLPNCLPA